MKKPIIFPLVILLVIVAVIWVWRSNSSNDAVVSDTSTSNNSLSSSTNNNSPANSSPDNPPPTPLATGKTLLLKVPFTPQAPTANWDELHNEACEEASALMVNAYFKGNTDATLPASVAEAEISKLVNWEQENFGYHLDTTSPETAKMIERVYGLKTKILNRFNLDDIKNELSQNHLIIFSADGRLLGNPNYRQPGPPHHMLVIKGYNTVGIVTNDPGTRNGRSYAYDFDTAYAAAGDWDHSTDSVNRSNKVAIVVWKE